MRPEEFQVFKHQIRHVLTTGSSLTLTSLTKILAAAKSLDPNASTTISVYEAVQELAQLAEFFDSQIVALNAVTWGNAETQELCAQIGATLQVHHNEVQARAAVEAASSQDAPTRH